MIRFLGAILITGCGLWFGERQARMLRERGQILEDLINGLEQVHRELELRQTPLPELLKGVGQRVRYPAGQLFSVYIGQTGEENRFAPLWDKQVEQLPMLTREERHSVSSLGGILGRYPVREQGAAIEGVCTYLKQCGERADKEYRRMGKVWRGLGAACGGILVILLL